MKAVSHAELHFHLLPGVDDGPSTLEESIELARAAGRYGEPAKSHALRILRAAALALIASDAHGGDRRPSLKPAVDALATAGEIDPARLAGAVPRALLERGLSLPPARMVA